MLAVVTVGSVVCGTASTLGMLIVGRVIQGASAAVFPVAFGIARDELPPERTATGIALPRQTAGVRQPQTFERRPTPF